MLLEHLALWKKNVLLLLLQTAEIELQAKHQLCNELSDCSSQLLQETASAPNFNATSLTDQVHGLQQGWQASTKVRRSYF